MRRSIARIQARGIGPQKTVPAVAPPFAGEQTVGRLEHLIEIARLLASFETVDETFHAAIAVAARILPLDSAILIETEGEGRTITLWTPPGRPSGASAGARANAEGVFDYLIGLAHGQPVASGNRRYIVLPLAVAERPVFGAIQMEGAAFDRQDLKFINAIANQFAVALDRDRAWRSDIARRAQAEEMEQTLRAQAAALVAADRQRSEFLSVLADELRTSLATSREIQQSLRAAAGNERIDHAMRAMNAQIQQTAQLIDDLHGLSALTHDEVQLRKARVDFCTILSRVAHGGTELLRGRGQQLSVAIPVQPAWVEADTMRIEQALELLIDKASLLLSPGGRIWLSARVEGDNGPDQRRALMVVTIRDDGAGSVAAVLPRVYDLLNPSGRRIDPADARFEAGMKLMQRVVELHGGSVSATSAGLGLGSEFQLRMPIDPRPAATLGPERRSS